MTYENEVLPTGVNLKTGGPKKRNMCMYMVSLMCGFDAIFSMKNFDGLVFYPWF